MADCWLSPIGCVKQVGNYIVTQCLWPPVKRHIDYWWCFDDNIQGLSDRARSLESGRYDVTQKVEEARLRAENLRPEIEDWSKASVEKLAEATRISQHGNKLKCWDIIARYLIGKRAKKTTEEILELLDKGGTVRISDPAPPQSMSFVSHEPTIGFESRKHIEEGIMESLRSKRVYMIGICGAGGVGKTTMVERIEERVRKENLVDEVVKVVVSQQLDMSKIQKEIAESLGLKFNEDGLVARAHKLHIRLAENMKRKLIIFDDVWKSFKVKDLGVPSENGFMGCKIILTSRIKCVCEEMKAQKVIQMEILTKEEAWNLFKEKAGDVEGPDLRTVAEDVAAECNGLPVALVVVGKALKNKSIYVWKDSLSQLRRANPIDFPEVLEDVYKPLKLSYDYLDNDSEKLLFLLCCLFPEDGLISIEDLTRYSFGLRMFNGIRSIVDARNRTHRLVEKLKSRFLLINSSKQNHVKMHDVVRDVAIFIGSKEKGILKSLEETLMDPSKENLSDICNWMAVDMSIEDIKIPAGLHFPNLRLFVMQKSNSFSVKYHITDDFFEGIENLNVLFISRITFGSLPHCLELLTNLRTLCLHRCKVKNISVVGKLASLEILSCYECNGIVEIPAEIGGLNRLRLLELYGCSGLQSIASGVISSLVGLEELIILDCFCDWESKEHKNKINNAALTELESLPNLTILDIQISNCNLAGEEINLSQKLDAHRISTFKVNWVPDKSSCGRDHEKIMNLKLPKDIVVGKWISKLLRNTECLELRGDGSNDLNLAECEKLKILMYRYCSTVKTLLDATDWRADCFALLESLWLYRLQNLEEICNGEIPEGSISFKNLQTLDVRSLPKLPYLWKSPIQNVSLCNLTSIYIYGCPKLRYMFSLEMSRSLLQLEDLDIEKCDSLELLFWNQIETITAAPFVFPKLKLLILNYLPSLTAFCQGVETLEFPCLTYLDIGYCPNFRTKIDKCTNLRIVNIGEYSTIFSFHPVRNWSLHLEELLIRKCEKVEQANFLITKKLEKTHVHFPKLERLTLEDLPNLTDVYRVVDDIGFPYLTQLKIVNCPKLCCLFSSLMAESLQQLQVLEIMNCAMIEEIFSDEIKNQGKGNFRFPELTKLELSNLPRLSTFYRRVESIDFPKLKYKKMGHLPRLDVLVPVDLEHHADKSFHFFCNHEVEIPIIKELQLHNLEENISNIWCYRIPINFFSNLMSFSIVNAKGIKNLISSSIAKNLSSLQSLRIESCHEMVEIIEDEEEMVDLPLFQKLYELTMMNLPKLRSFCRWKLDLELPSLKKVRIDDCPLMETFTLGCLSTPNINWVYVNKKRIETEDVNDAIHQNRI